MPQFAPGVSKTAKIPIMVSPSGLACQVELFLGPNDQTKVASSGLVNFTSTGAAQEVRCSVTMPSAGSYHVYIDVYAGGGLILSYVAAEDVVITAVPSTLIMGQMHVGATDGTILDMYWNCIFVVPIINGGNTRQTRSIRIQASYDGQALPDYTEQITLDPGKILYWKYEHWVDFRRTTYYKLVVTGDWGDQLEGIIRSSDIAPDGDFIAAMNRHGVVLSDEIAAENNTEVCTWETSLVKVKDLTVDKDLPVCRVEAEVYLQGEWGFPYAQLRKNGVITGYPYNPYANEYYHNFPQILSDLKVGDKIQLYLRTTSSGYDPVYGHWGGVCNRKFRIVW